MKKLLSIILAGIMLMSIAATASADIINPFSDVAEDAWYRDDVIKAVSTGIINGKSTTEFKPDDFLTYAEAAKLAACMNQVYINGKVSITSGEPWYQPYVDYCAENKIITKTYNYDENATRAGYMEIFANALPEDAFSDINNIPDGSISDIKENSSYASYVYKMYRAGIVTGVDELHNCDPDAYIKRCEVATIISRMMDEEKRVEFEIVEKIYTKDEIIEDEDDENNQTVKYENQKTDGGDDVNIKPENPEVTNKVPTQEVTQEIIVVPNVPIEVPNQFVQNAELTIHKQPEGLEAEGYGVQHELYVQVFGGKAPYTYEWQYYGYRNQTTTIENGEYVSGAQTERLILSVEKDNTILGKNIVCKITDSLGATVTTDKVKVYGPFSMQIEQSLSENGENILVGRVADGVLKIGEKVSVIRNDKVVAIGIVKDLQMFNKSLDEIIKDDEAGIVFAIDDGVRPSSGDTVVKYLPYHIVDTSDIIN